MAQTMECTSSSNQNSIYVLNASYNAYGDFGTYAAAGSATAAATGPTKREPTRTRPSCSLQHKFKSFGAGYGQVGVDYGGGSTSNYVNPATSMSTAMCSPATAALQKLFNCSVSVGSGGGCQNVNNSNSTGNSNSNNNNNNPTVSSHNNGCLSAAGKMLESTAGVGSAGAVALHNGSSNTNSNITAATSNNSKKKCTKSTLIAKKTKFLKFLEEEKWRSSATTRAPTTSTSTTTMETCTSSNEAASSTSTSSSSSSSLDPYHSHVGQPGEKGRSSSSGNNGWHLKNQESASAARVERNKLNNWSMHNDDNNKLTNYNYPQYQQQQQKQQQQQQQQQSLSAKPQTRSSFELYQEAADILGLSCSLCDNCRCLDCQSGYFDCANDDDDYDDDDDDESYAEELMDDVCEAYDYGIEELQMLLMATTTRQRQERGQVQIHGHEQVEGHQQAMCYAVNCQQKCQQLPTEEPNEKQQQEQEQEQMPGAMFTSGEQHHRLAIDFDLINATAATTGNQPQQANCETFNDLSLIEGQVQQEPFT
ncbi:AF4/FMR2 family member lilli [Drosophila tropicalis]|uniref:AF4/FMR2 family member lilli n=1 Tax=Drosophila tropicalis TaxID=46794 RepID=UPI0035ABB391